MPPFRPGPCSIAFRGISPSAQRTAQTSNVVLPLARCGLRKGARAGGVGPNGADEGRRNCGDVKGVERQRVGRRSGGDFAPFALAESYAYVRMMRCDMLSWQATMLTMTLREGKDGIACDFVLGGCGGYRSCGRLLRLVVSVCN